MVTLVVKSFSSLFDSSMLLGLLYDLLRGSSVCQQQMIQSQGFMIIGHLLQKASPIHLTEEVVDILLGLARFVYFFEHLKL